MYIIVNIFNYLFIYRFYFNFQNFAFWASQKYLQLRNDFPPGSDIGLSYVQRGFAFYF